MSSGERTDSMKRLYKMCGLLFIGDTENEKFTFLKKLPLHTVCNGSFFSNRIVMVMLYDKKIVN